MSRFAATWFKNILCPRFVMGFLATLTILAGFAAGQNDYNKPSEVGEGSLLYAHPSQESMSPCRWFIPMSRWTCASGALATVTQQYSNSSTTPIEAIYVFPLPRDAAYMTTEIRIGDRVNSQCES